MCIILGCEKPHVRGTTLCEDHIGKTVNPFAKAVDRKTANDKEQQTVEASE